MIGTDLWPLVDPAAARAVGTGPGTSASTSAGTSTATGTDRPGTPPPEIPIRAVAELIERLERM